jgi:hypothetical protein
VTAPVDPLTANERKALDESNAHGGALRAVNRYVDSIREEDFIFIDSFKGMRCLAYAKDGKLFRSVMHNHWYDVPLNPESNTGRH